MKHHIKGKVWISKNGKIECPGDHCPKECDDTCPIFLNTQAMMLLANNCYDDALECLSKAAEIEPEFYDLWNNMGTIYGSRGEHEKAVECFLKAHEIDKKKLPPVYGLILAYRDLGKYKECLEWCNEYVWMGGDIPIEDIRAKCRGQKKRMLRVRIQLYHPRIYIRLYIRNYTKQKL